MTTENQEHKRSMREMRKQQDMDEYSSIRT